MKVKIKKLHPDAIIPKYATEGAACFDLHAIATNERELVIPGAPVVFQTGLAFEIPDGHAMFIFSRSGHGFNFDIRLSNCVGVIDADYKGQVKVKMTADGNDCLPVKDGDRIAQAMILPVPKVEFEEVQELTETERGQGGFGSTGS